MEFRKKGFTILEILVVLAVLAILIGIAVPRIKGMQEQANITKAKSELKTIQTAIESYYINKGSYPVSSMAITTDISKEKSIPQILSGVLVDPFSDKSADYAYQRSNSGEYYVIVSLGTFGMTWADLLLNGFAITDQGSLSAKAITFVEQGVICVTNGTGCD